MNKTLLLLLLFANILCTQLCGQSIPAVKVYPYYVEPEEYPDYTRRAFAVPTWQTFHNKVQFVGGRGWSEDFGTIREKAPYWIKGAKVMRPNYSHFLMEPEALRKSLTYMKEKGYYLFNINAFGPGTPPNGSFGQFRVESWKADMMKEILGDRYLGFDLGEQDGRYWADSRSIDYPMSDNYKERYLNCIRYMHKAACSQGDVISQLSVKWFWHYPIKEGFITSAGAECQNKTYTSNPQVQYSFIRGACKQYGTLWYGDISVFNSWGYKTYGPEKENHGPSKGNSLAWMKRMLLTQYQYNAAILGFESSWYEQTDEKYQLSPIGVLQTDMQNFVEKYPRSGPQYTPIAFLMDFFSGWMPPSEPYEQKYKVWTFLPYQTGDFFAHNLFKMFYPGYDEVGLHKNEYGGLCNTPYGDVADVLLSDTRASVLKRYAIVVVAGEISTDLPEVSDKLTQYMNDGGQVIMTAGNFRKIFPFLPSDVASESFHVKEYDFGKGKLSVLESPNMGMTADNVFTEQIKDYFDRTFRKTSMFSVGDSLGYIVNVEKDGNYLLGIYNHSLVPRHFDIKSEIGSIRKIEELHPVRDITGKPGYLPEGYEQTALGRNDKNTIAAADVRLFRIKIDEDSRKIVKLPKVTMEEKVDRRFLPVGSLVGLSDKLHCVPSFFDSYSGVKISWDNILAVDSISFQEQAWWFNLKQMQFAIEFDKSFQVASDKDPLLIQRLFDRVKASGNITMLVIPAEFTDSVRSKIKETFGTRPSIVCPDKIKPMNEVYYFSHHDTQRDITEVLKENLLYAMHFGGVKLDAAYLLARSMETCKAEKQKIDGYGMKIIVDLSREMNNYPGMTWLSELEDSYERTVYLYHQLFEKMSVMGIDKIIIGTHMRPEMWRKDFLRTPEESMVEGMSHFIQLASEYGITVLLQNSSHRFYPSRLLAKPVEVLAVYRVLRAKYNNVKLAANLATGESFETLITSFSNDMGACIFASSGADDREYPVAFYKGRQEYIPIIQPDIVRIFDGCYQHIDELLFDLKLVEQKDNTIFGGKIKK